MSPVACDCLAQCLAAEDEVCGAFSAGCNDAWKEEFRMNSHRTFAWNVTTRSTFHALLTCIAWPSGVTPHSSIPIPFHQQARLTTLSRYSQFGYEEQLPGITSAAAVPAFGAGAKGFPEDLRGGGFEPMYPAGAEWVSPEKFCVQSDSSIRTRSLFTKYHGCSGRGRCMLTNTSTVGTCICVDGAFGTNCEHVCSNDCFHHCSGHGKCIHGWCKCDAGWYGVDCSDTLAPHTGHRSSMHYDVGQFGPGPVGIGTSERLKLLPPDIRKHVQLLRHAIYVYDLPPSINRDGETWMSRYWDEGSFTECDPVHTRRIYSAQTHFDAHILHDAYVRTLDPRKAKLFYVPLFLAQRHTWGGSVTRSMRRMVHHLQTAYPYWNASGGRDHVFFVFGEKLHCAMPPEISQNSIVMSHWGGKRGWTNAWSDCVDETKDIIIPPITPIQHDLPKFHEKLGPNMKEADTSSFSRSGPLLLFAGGIASFGASQDRSRKGGVDTEKTKQKFLKITERDNCADPKEVRNVRCRQIYSMGVRQAVWRAKLWAEPDMKIVSAGIPDYMSIARTAKFCLHTEGNSWGTRLIDYAALECLPLIVNDGMVLPYERVLPYSDFALHYSKADVEQIPTRLRAINETTQLKMHAALRQHKRAFIWFRPEGLAYEYALASLGERLGARLLG